METYTFNVIGKVRCGEQYKFEAPRQGVFSSASAVIELDSCYGGDAIADLAGFERIWVVFVFHRNIDAKWKARVQPPCAPEKRKYSVFATRSPYRPNPVGMSCVKLERIDGRKLYISGHDLLDGTPVLDIKPYIPCADAFPEAAAGWRDELVMPEWTLSYAEKFLQQAEFLRMNGAPDMVNFCDVQLVRDPLDRKRHRVTVEDDGRGYIGCRTWRLHFTFDAEKYCICMVEIRSNYRDEELVIDSPDQYGDKELHRKYREVFVP